MKRAVWTWVSLTVLAAITPVRAADDPALERMAICQDSWLDRNKDDPARMNSFAEHFYADFARSEKDPFFEPKGDASVFGLRITHAYPENVGMGVGFSLLVDTTFDDARRRIEAKLGKPLTDCESGDGMRTCGLGIAERRTVTLMSEEDPTSKKTLVGCYYYYEK
jgi:hypothetical protein